jgi:hypothetical protein
MNGCNYESGWKLGSLSLWDSENFGLLYLISKYILLTTAFCLYLMLLENREFLTWLCHLPRAEVRSTVTHSKAKQNNKWLPVQLHTTCNVSVAQNPIPVVMPLLSHLSAYSWITTKVTLCNQRVRVRDLSYAFGGSRDFPFVQYLQKRVSENKQSKE